MLTTYLKKPVTLERYRVGPAGPHLDQFTDWLEAWGYRPDRVLHLLRGVHCFSCWAYSAGLPVQALDGEALAAFGQHLHSEQRLHYPSGSYGHLFMGARHFVTFLAATGQVTSPALLPSAASEPPLLVGSCTSSLRRIPTVCKPSKMPSFLHLYEGVLLWFPLSFSPR
jgi:hypothetical protein